MDTRSEISISKTETVYKIKKLKISKTQLLDKINKIDKPLSDS